MVCSCSPNSTKCWPQSSCQSCIWVISKLQSPPPPLWLPMRSLRQLSSAALVWFSMPFMGTQDRSASKQETGFPCQRCRGPGFPISPSNRWLNTHMELPEGKKQTNWEVSSALERAECHLAVRINKWLNEQDDKSVCFRYWTDTTNQTGFINNNTYVETGRHDLNIWPENIFNLIKSESFLIIIIATAWLHSWMATAFLSVLWTSFKSM